MEPTERRKHFFDLKIPLGSLLSFYGILLLLYGLLGPSSVYKKSFNLNVNVTWGILMILVGLGFLVSYYLGRRARE